MLKGFVPPRPEDAGKCLRMGWWRGLTLGDLLDRAAVLYPDKEALVDDRRRMTYSQLKDAVDRPPWGFRALASAMAIVFSSNCPTGVSSSLRFTRFQCSTLPPSCSCPVIRSLR